MDELLSLLSEVSKIILPILGVVLLVYLIVFIKKLVDTLKSVDNILKTVDYEINKLNAPLDTAVKLSKTVDTIHDASVKGMANALTWFSANFSNIVEYLKEVLAEWKANRNSNDIMK